MTTPRGRGDAPIEAPATLDRPTTKPGLDLYHDHRNGMTIFPDAMRSRVLAIEAAARDEGRREGCSKHHSAEDCRAYFDQTLEEARDEGRQEAVREIRAAVDEQHPFATADIRRVRSILDDVARHGRSSDPEEADDES